MEDQPQYPELKDLKTVARAVLKEMRDSKILDAQSYNMWLLQLHKHYTDRMLSDNERIWRTGAIFVPVALGAFGALVALKSPVSWWHILVLGLPSTLLLLLWLVIADNHRAFQQKSEACFQAIEEELGLFTIKIPSKAQSKGYDRFVTFPQAIQKSRWWLAFAVAAFWVVLFILALVGVLK